MWIHTPRLVIAAPASGSGKSIVAMGLMAALAQTHVVQGFKIGPDYIDPMYHTAATGRPSRNLDTWMVGLPRARAAFARACLDADVAIVEGVMGLFDGYGGQGESGSTAQAAKLLRAPVLLVLDVGRMSRSAGAMALGYRMFDPGLRVVGAICNRVGSRRHARWVTKAVEAVGLPVLGCLPKMPDLHIPERHLGLYTAVERQAQVRVLLDRARKAIAAHIDLERVWAIARSAQPFDVGALPYGASTTGVPRMRLAVARDEAFCFYYADNINLLRAAGAEIVFFSPLRDAVLPERVGGVYLGGGYPELYAAQLSENVSLRREIRAAHRARMPIYAECGGLMALTQSITDLDDKTYPMFGVLPGRSQMRQRLTMGYRQVTALRDSLLLTQGEQVRGHEFHYSDWIDCPPEAPRAYRLARRGDEARRKEGWAQENVLASFVHLHFDAQPGMAAHWVEACIRWQNQTA